MKNITTVIFTSLFLVTPSLWAQTAETQQTTQKLISPYGDNPNIFHVWAYKAQEGLMGAAHNIDAMADRGVASIRSSAGQAWGNTKELTSEAVEKVDTNTTKVAEEANIKLKDTREVLWAAPEKPAPIVQGTLSHSSSQNDPASSEQHTTPPHNTTTTYPVHD